MRAYLPAFELTTPASLQEALDLLAEPPHAWRPFAGGTDLMVLLEAGKLSHKRYLNIWNLDELRGIEVRDSHITFGALTTYTAVQQESVVRQEFPMLCQAASETGGLAIQNRGTLGGNIVNASPAADSPPALLVYDAEVELTSKSGERWVDYQEFHTGYKQMLIRPEELLTRIRLPRRSSGWHDYYRKVGTRKAQAISKICFAGSAQLSEAMIQDIRIALGSVAPVPLKCLKTAAAIKNRQIDQGLVVAAQAELAKEISPISDIRSSKDYRLRVSQNLLADFLLGLTT